jgi:hypothetical protein
VVTVPKRTNEFQRLIAFIERAAAPAGARVTESPELFEYEGSSKREIDILIECEVGGHPVRIAVECRAEKRKQNKQWIDELYGRFRDLGIQVVIAVSRSGFTKGAIQKAERLGIRALTLEQALAEDWETALLKLNVRFRGTVRELDRVALHYPPGIESPRDDGRISAWLIQGPSGEDPETVLDTALRLYNADAERLTEEHIAENRLGDFSAPHDNDFEYSITYDAHGRYVVPADGTPRLLRVIVLHIKAGVRFVDASHERYRYEASLVTVASAQIENEPPTSVAIVQPSKPAGNSVVLTWGLLKGGTPHRRREAKPRKR